jgi:hypothetical protein
LVAISSRVCRVHGPALAAQRVVGHPLQRLGRQLPRDERAHPSVDRVRGDAGELLEHDRPYQCAEVAVGVAGPMFDRADPRHERAEHGVAAGDLGDGGGERRAGHRRRG